MRITEDEYKAVQDAPDPQPLSGGAWPAAQGGGIVRGQSDNLGHYWDSASQAWRNENDNSLYDSSYSSGALTGGAWPAAQTSTGLGNAPQYDQPSVAQDNAYNQSQYQYAGDYGGSSVYTDPASGNVWNNGLWYDNSGNVWSNEANSWLSPAQYNDFAQQSYDYANAQANPQFQPNTYQQPGGDWYNYDNQPALNNVPFQDPGYESPWNPSYMKDQGGGGFLGGLKDFIQPGINAVVNNPVVGAGMIAGNAANDFIDNLTGTSRQQRINDQLSGNALVNDVSGGRVDLNQLPYGAGYVTDAALAPASYLGWGATGGAGATAWEGVKQIGSGALGNAAAKWGGSDQAASIPYFGDQPAILRSLEAGGIAGIGAYAGIGALGNAAKEAGGFGPLLKSEVGSTPPLGKGGTPEGGLPRPDIPTEAVTPPTDTTLNPVRRQIADALDNELKFRNSGEAEAIKAAKRAEQASGINLAQAGNTSAETLANVSSGAKVGQFFDKTPGLKLPEEQYNAALKDVLDSTEGFDKLQAVKALDKLQNGQRLQPGEIKTLGKLYGPEIEAKIRMTNADRIQTVAELTPEDIAKINRQAEVDGKRVATLEVQSQRQHELADNLQKQLNMDPTNKALKKAAEDARARGLAQQNTADRLLADRAEKLTANLPSRTETQILRTEQAATGTAKAAEQADKVALRNESKAFFKASPEQAVTNAKNVVAKLDVPDSLKSQLIDTIEIGARKQSLILDGMGDSGPGILRKIYASATGEVTDSYTSKLLTQRAFMENALQSGGLSKEASKAIGKLLQDAELRQRFGNAIPDYVTKSLDEAKFNFSEGGAIKGLADISQELKNTQFGIGDVAVFGQQAAKAGLTNAPQIVTGYVNRALQALHLGGVNTAIPEASIARDTQYALDGLALHSHAITDIVSNERTLLSRLGAPGRVIDQSVALPIIKKLTDFQFDTVLGNLRKTIYEGNLVMAHLSGADIADPAVRLRAAEMANAATGAGKLAQRSARANAEKAFLLSPSMRRAQIQQMTQVIKGLSHQDTALTSALAITSSVGLTLGVGKLLSDYLNLPFETDPSKPGFGNIRLPDGTTVNPFSQEQIAKAFARSLRILAEDPSTDGAKRISEEWGKILVSSASPGLRPILASAGVGIDQNGYHWGDLGQGQSLGQRVLNALPIPPLAQSVIQNGVSPVRTPLEALGFNAYPESPYAKRAQELGPNPTEKQLFDYEQKNGRIYSSDPTIKAQQVEADRAHQEQLDRQNARDTELTTGTWSPAKATQWREQRKQDNLYFAGRFDQLYSGVNFKDQNVTDVDRYYKAIADNTDRVTGDINWDAVDAATKGLNQEYIKANTNLRDTSIEKSYRTALDTIESSGYFDRQEQTWAKVQKYSDEAKAYPDYYAWKDAKLEEQTQKFMDRYGYDKLYAASMAEKAVNASAPEKIYDGYSKQWKADWVMQNPAAAYQAWTWGYYTPTDDMKAFLNKWAKGQ